MKKFNLLIFEEHKKELLKSIQRFGDVHFKNIQNVDPDDELLVSLSKDVPDKSVSTIEADLASVDFALSKLSAFVEKPSGLAALNVEHPTLEFDEFDHYTKGYEWHQVVDAVRAYDDQITAAKADIVKLTAESDQLRQYRKLDINVLDIDKSRRVSYLMGTVPKTLIETFTDHLSQEFPAAYIEAVSEIKEDVVVLIICLSSEQQPIYQLVKDIGFSRLSLPFTGIPLTTIESNKEQIETLRTLVTEATDNISKLVGEYEKLSVLHDYYASLLEREKISTRFLKTNKTIVIEGWVPIVEYDEFTGLISKVCGEDYYIDANDVDINDTEVPIKLKNNALVKSFESITEMFALPLYNEADPTPILTPFYMLFFGLIMGDAGYGIFLMVACYIAVTQFKLAEGTKNFLTFFGWLGVATFLTGILYGSLFGQTVPFLLFLRTADGTPRPILDYEHDVTLLLAMSVGLGVIHLIYALFVKMFTLFKLGKPVDALLDSGFLILFLLGGTGLLLATIGVIAIPSAPFGYMLVIAMVGIALTSDRESKTLAGRLANGLYNVYGLSGYVGDLVSYTRIVALMLSGAYISYAFNKMVSIIPSGPFGLSKIIFGGLIFIIGQALNFALGALGAYVHTSRLQYVEFFGKFYEGGGVTFEPFKLKNKYINIK
jgi:V/A-type H+-transporting ATPase subunit I